MVRKKQTWLATFRVCEIKETEIRAVAEGKPNKADRTNQETTELKLYLGASTNSNFCGRINMNTAFLHDLLCAFDNADSDQQRSIKEIIIKEVGMHMPNYTNMRMPNYTNMISVPEFIEVVGGHKIAAIKLYRARTGTSLKEAKETIEEFMSKIK